MQGLVDKREVHKHHEETVLLRSHEMVSSHAMRFIAGWQRLHERFDSASATPDPGLVAETLRQATIALAHKGFGVPFGWAFLMDRMTVHITAPVPHGAGGPAVSLEARAERVATRGSRLRGLVSHVVVGGEGRQIATGRGELRVIDDRLYERLRGDRSHLTNLDLTPRNLRDSPALRSSPHGLRGREWRVVFDPRDVLYFDHPVDHVPGMLLFQAARKAATQFVADAELVGFDGEYHRFVELSAPILVRIESSRPLDALRREVVVGVYDADTLAMSSRVIMALGGLKRSGLDQFGGSENGPILRIANHSWQDDLPHPSESLEKVRAAGRGD